MKEKNVSGSCGSWILGDEKCGWILWILDLDLFVCGWVLWILDPAVSLTPKSGHWAKTEFRGKNPKSSLKTGKNIFREKVMPVSLMVGPNT